MKQIDSTSASHIYKIFDHEHGTELELKQPKENASFVAEPCPTNNNVSSAKTHEVAMVCS